MTDFLSCKNIDYRFKGSFSFLSFCLRCRFYFNPGNFKNLNSLIAYFILISKFGDLVYKVLLYHLKKIRRKFLSNAT